MVWYRALKFVICLEYEYTQVAVNLFCECQTCPLFGGGLQLRFAIFLYLKECVVILKSGSSVMRLDKRDKAYKAQAHCLT